MPAIELMQVKTNSSSGMEVISEIRFFEWYKAAGPDGYEVLASELTKPLGSI